MQLRNKKPPARRWPRKAVGRKPGGNDRSDFSASTRAGDGFILSGAEDLVKVHSPNVTTYSAQGASWTENHTAKKMLPDIERATCLESAAMERRGEGACVWSQTTCHVRPTFFVSLVAEVRAVALHAAKAGWKLRT